MKTKAEERTEKIRRIETRIRDVMAELEAADIECPRALKFALFEINREMAGG